MTTRLLALPIALVPTLAFAQAPGESYAQSPAMVAPAPQQVIVVRAPEVEPLANRFAIGLGLGGFSVAPEDAVEGSETDFSVAEIQLRFRATRRLEVLLAFAGGREQLEDEQEGDLAMDQVTLGLRFNFRPYHHWNWYVMAGFGSTLIAPHDTPKEARDDLRRGHGMFGIGLEHRWQHFALTAELRGIAVAEDEERSRIMTVGGGSLVDGRELGGAQVSLGGSYYF